MSTTEQRVVQVQSWITDTRKSTSECLDLAENIRDLCEEWSNALRGDLEAKELRRCHQAEAKIERLQDSLRAASGGCRILSEGDNCNCGLCKRDEEIERLREHNSELCAEVLRLEQAALIRNTDVILASEQTHLNDEVKRLNSIRLKQQAVIEAIERYAILKAEAAQPTPEQWAKNEGEWQKVVKQAEQLAAEAKETKEERKP